MVAWLSLVGMNPAGNEQEVYVMSVKQKVYDVLMESGDEITLRDLAREAGVSLGSAQRYKSEFQQEGTEGQVVPVSAESGGSAGKGDEGGVEVPAEPALGGDIEWPNVKPGDYPAEGAFSHLPEDEYVSKREHAEDLSMGMVATHNAMADHVNKSGVQLARNIKSKVDGMREYAKGVNAKLTEIDQRLNLAMMQGGGTVGSIQVVMPSGEVNEIEGLVHHLMPEILKTLCRERKVQLTGETGAGKTHVAGQCAEALGLPLFVYCCTEAMSEGHITGRLGFDNIYLESAWIKAYEQGGVVLLDEFDASNDNTRLVLNSALANEYMSVPNRIDNPIAHRHEDFYCIIATNTWGSGADAAYSGRTSIDLATKDRFMMCKFHYTYDPELEKQLLGDSLGEHAYTYTPPSQGTYRMPSGWGKHTLWTLFNAIRQAIIENNIDEWAMSTRTLLAAQRMKHNGYLHKDILARYFTGWDPADQRQVETYVTNTLANVNTTNA